MRPALLFTSDPHRLKLTHTDLPNLWLPSGHRWQSRSVGWRRRGARGRDRTLRLPV